MRNNSDLHLTILDLSIKTILHSRKLATGNYYLLLLLLVMIIVLFIYKVSQPNDQDPSISGAEHCD